MTKSLPWSGIIGGAGAGDDSGRYTAGEWWSAWSIQQQASGLIVPTSGASLRTVTDWTNRGVYYGVANRLAVTDGGGFVAGIATGAALVEGALFYENTARTLTMPANQTYHVVVRKNYRNAAYTPPGYAAGDGVVPAYTCRITWVAAPLVQDTTRVTYWDIPLATVVTDGSGITSITDTREWVEYIMRRQGGDASNWLTVGASDYTPLDVIEQVGSQEMNWAGTAFSSGTVTYPQAFSNVPLVHLEVYALDVLFGVRTIVANPNAIGTGGFTWKAEVTDGTGVAAGTWGNLLWRAIGPR